MGARKVAAYAIGLPLLLAISLFLTLIFSDSIRKTAILGFLDWRVAHYDSVGTGEVPHFCVLVVKVLFVSVIVSCKGDYPVCGRKKILDVMTDYGWDQGFAPGLLEGHKASYFSHELITKILASPGLLRSENIFIGADIRLIDQRIVPRNTMLNLGTSDPERLLRRQVFSESMPALKKTLLASRPAVVIPLGRRNTVLTDCLHTTYATVFSWAFGVSISEQALKDIETYQTVTGLIAVGLSNGGGHEEEIDAIYERMMKIIADSPVGKDFIAAWTAKGMDVTSRLRELTAVFLFAGVGGTSDLVKNTLVRIQTNPGFYVPLFKKDSKAFVIEHARLTPPVGGVVIKESDSKPLKYRPTGPEAKVTGNHSLGMIWIRGANTDPKVWPQPELFDITRANRGEMVSWAGRLADIEAGTATRACPGALMAIDVAQKVVEAFLPSVAGKVAEL